MALALASPKAKGSPLLGAPLAYGTAPSLLCIDLAAYDAEGRRGPEGPLFGSRVSRVLCIHPRPASVSAIDGPSLSPPG